jgi:hypothetical protein
MSSPQPNPIPRSSVRTKNPELLSRERREVRKLTTLAEVARLISDMTQLKSTLPRILELLARHHGVVRGFVMLGGMTSKL